MAEFNLLTLLTIARNEDLLQDCIVVLDNLMMEVTNDKDFSAIFSRESHHENLCVFSLWEDPFPKGKVAQTMTANSDYDFIFPNPTHNHRLQIMLRRHDPQHSNVRHKKMMNFFDREAQSYPFVLVNHLPNGNKKYRYVVRWLRHNCFERDYEQLQTMLLDDYAL